MVIIDNQKVLLETEVDNLDWNNAIIQVWIVNWTNVKIPVKRNHIVSLVESKNVRLFLKATFLHSTNKFKILHWIEYMFHFPQRWIFKYVFQRTFTSCCKKMATWECCFTTWPNMYIFCSYSYNKGLCITSFNCVKLIRAYYLIKEIKTVFNIL